MLERMVNVFDVIVFVMAATAYLGLLFVGAVSLGHAGRTVLERRLEKE